MYGCFVYMYVCVSEYVPGVHEGLFYSLELKLQIDVSYHVDPGK